MDAVAAHLGPGDPQSAHGTALGLYAMMVGTVQLARAMSDPKLADEVLDQGIRNALASLAATPPGSGK